MQKNKLTITINKPIEDVFAFTTNPKNTHLWVPSIEEEIADDYPPRIGTQYKSRGKDSDWNYYNVSEFEENSSFALVKSDKSYSVKYTYKKIDADSTEMEYCEYGELGDPFTKEVFNKLKSIMEAKNNL